MESSKAMNKSVVSSSSLHRVAVDHHAQRVSKLGLYAAIPIYVIVAAFFYSLFGASINATADNAFKYTAAAYSVGLFLILLTASMCFYNRENPLIKSSGRPFMTQVFLGAIIAISLALCIAAVATKQIKYDTKTETMNAIYSLLVCKVVAHQILFNGAILGRQNVIYLIFVQEKQLAGSGTSPWSIWIKSNFKMWLAMFFVFLLVFFTPLTIWVQGGPEYHVWWSYKVFPGFFLITAIFLVYFAYLSYRCRGAGERYSDFNANIRFEVVYFFHCLIVCCMQQYMIMTKSTKWDIHFNGPVYNIFFISTAYFIDNFWFRLYYINSGQAKDIHTGQGLTTGGRTKSSGSLRIDLSKSNSLMHDRSSGNVTLAPLSAERNLA